MQVVQVVVHRAASACCAPSEPIPPRRPMAWGRFKLRSSPLPCPVSGRALAGDPGWPVEQRPVARLPRALGPPPLQARPSSYQEFLRGANPALPHAQRTSGGQREVHAVPTFLGRKGRCNRSCSGSLQRRGRQLAEQREETHLAALPPGDGVTAVCRVAVVSPAVTLGSSIKLHGHCFSDL